MDAAEADVDLSKEFTYPVPVVWEWLNDPQKRSLWMHHREWSAGLRPSGRPGPGARNHCTHGKDTSTETILDWKPFEYVTSRQEGKQFALVETIRLEPTADGGTRIRDLIRYESRLPVWLRKRLYNFITRQVVKYKNDAVFDDMARMMAKVNDGGAVPREEQR